MPLQPAALDALNALLPPLFDALERIVWVQRHLHPAFAEQLADELAPSLQELTAPFQALEAVPWPDDLRFMRERLVEVTSETLTLGSVFVDSPRTKTHPIDL